MSRMRHCLRAKRVSGLMAVCCLALAQHGAGVQFYSDGIIREVAGETAVVELPKWPLVVERGMKVGFFEIADVFAREGSDKVLVAEINVTAIGKITEVSGETAGVSLTDINGKSKIQPSTGSGVLINNDLKHGRQYVVRDDSLSAKLIFQENFGEGTKVGLCWESLPGAISVEKGKLVIDRYKKELQNVQAPPHGAAAMIKLNVMAFGSDYTFNQDELTRGAVCFEFDLEAEGGIKISLDSSGYGTALIGVDFVLGRYEQMQSGVYVNNVRGDGKLPGSIGSSKHVFLTITPSCAELRVGKEACKAERPAARPVERSRDRDARGRDAADRPFRNIVIFTKGKFSIDNFKIWKLPDDSVPRNAKVAAFNSAADRVAVLKGNSKEWRGNLLGREILFGEGGAKGTILADVKDYVVCEINEAESASVRSASAITLGKVVRRIAPPSETEDYVPLEKKPAEEGAAEKPPLPQATASPKTVYDEMVAGAGSTFELRPVEGMTARKGAYALATVLRTSDGRMALSPATEIKPDPSGPGYVYPVSAAIAQPVSGQMLGVQAGKAIRCQITREGNTLYAVPMEPADEAAVKNAKYGMVSAQLAKSSATNSFFEIDRQEFTCDSSSAKQTFWNVVSGKWGVKNGRYVSGSPLDKEGVPAMVSTHEMDGNFRFEFDVIVERPVKQIFCTYTKDISCMFYSVTQKSGLTFGFGAEGYGGVSTDGGIPGAVRIDSEKQTKGKSRAQDKEETVLKWEGHKQYLGKSFEAMLGKSYHMRYERLGSMMVMYINGRKIHEEATAYLVGKLQVWLLSPESVLSIDGVCLSKLPESARPAASIPPLGCFGYVVATDGQDVYMDSGIPGLRRGQKISIVAVEAQMRGKSEPNRILSQDIKLIASGAVAECGSSMTRVTISGGTEPVKPGMKVLTRKCSGTFTLNEQELGDIEEEL